jgi:hypothetical protein
MRKLTSQFIRKHIEEHFMIGINSLYWMGTTKATISNVLEYREYPLFSKSFYLKYGNFQPQNPQTEHVIRDIKHEKYSLEFLDSYVKWDEFVFDVIGFFNQSHSPQDLQLKMSIKEHFFEHYDYLAAIEESYDDIQQKMIAKNRLDNLNDERMLKFFEFRDYLQNWKPQN